MKITEDVRQYAAEQGIAEEEALSRLHFVTLDSFLVVPLGEAAVLPLS